MTTRADVDAAFETLRTTLTDFCVPSVHEEWTQDHDVIEIVVRNGMATGDHIKHERGNPRATLVQGDESILGHVLGHLDEAQRIADLMRDEAPTEDAKASATA